MDNVVIASEMTGKVEQDFFVGSMRLHILRHAAGREVFGQGLIPGTLYPILHTPERGGYLRSRLKHVAEERRRIYVVTALSASRQEVLALFHEILGDQDESPKSRRSVRHRGAPCPSKRRTSGSNTAPNQNSAQAATTHFTPNFRQGK